MIHDNQGSPFVLFKKDYNRDRFWILFLRKGFGIRRGVMVIHLEKDCNKDSFWILFLRKGLGIRRGVMGIHLEKDKRTALIVMYHIYWRPAPRQSGC